MVDFFDVFLFFFGWSIEHKETLKTCFLFHLGFRCLKRREVQKVSIFRMGCNVTEPVNLSSVIRMNYLSQSKSAFFFFHSFNRWICVFVVGEATMCGLNNFSIWFQFRIYIMLFVFVSDGCQRVHTHTHDCRTRKKSLWNFLSAFFFFCFFFFSLWHLHNKSLNSSHYKMNLIRCNSSIFEFVHYL